MKTTFRDGFQLKRAQQRGKMGIIFLFQQFIAKLGWEAISVNVYLFICGEEKKNASH
jgi:hypothetical protein